MIGGDPLAHVFPPVIVALELNFFPVCCMDRELARKNDNFTPGEAFFLRNVESSKWT
jgi:hypothetical protein